MSSRERWIVYPLLLLALGTALRPKYMPQERVVCRQLFVVDDEDRPRIQLFVHERSARTEQHTAGDNDLTSEAEVRLTDRRGIPVARMRSDAASRAGLIETRTSTGRPQTALLSSDSGGEIVAYDNDRQQMVSIGHRGGEFGLINTNENTRTFTVAPIAKLAPTK
jgi:hypothetical protein